MFRFLACFLAFAAVAPSQTPPPAPAPPRRRPPDFPQRAAADAALVENGKAIYGVHCAFCHGADARGGSGGPNLIRAESVLSDKDGELIGPIIRGGREGMPKFDLTPQQISGIAAFVHSFRVGGYDISRMTPPTIVTGDAKSGQAYFGKTCSACHSVTGDLKGIGSRIPDPKQLQQTWLMPGGGGRFAQPAAKRAKPTTVTVTFAGGNKAEGRLNRIDDFFVTLTDADGIQRTFTREGDLPKVEIHDPLKPHRELLGKYRDRDIHDVTAFLVTVK